MFNPDDVKGLFLGFNALKDFLLGAIGGLCAYFLEYKKAIKDKVPFAFSFGAILINASLGIFVAYLTGTLIEQNTYGRDAIVGMSGLTAYNILILAESRFAEWVIDKFTKKD